ncbi:MAG: sulfate ABC transporter ATP-binding protein [Firmicutes bacterium]|nr:sulfate ABC transporter ATP-binding protein [Bacillota bacterium]
MSIEIRQINKTFGKFSVLKDINLEAPTGELVALLGPSGSGKTTLLRIIAGLEIPDSGTILFHGENATSQSIRERNVGFVFQHYALFKHLTVFENVAFGLRVRARKMRLPETLIRSKVHNLLKLVQMEWLADRYPTQLSGGQRQRIALARALAVEPKVMLLDEPFGALDAKVRKELRRWIRKLHDEIHITSIFVTHDQEEALEVADRVVIMNKGKIEQIGTPEEVYEQPANLFVYKFLGNVNLFHGRLCDGQVKIGAGAPDPFQIPTPPDLPVVAYARPHELEITHENNGTESIAVTVSYIRAIGPMVRLELKRSDTGDLIEAEISKERYKQLRLKIGERVFVELPNLKVFTEDYSI